MGALWGPYLRVLINLNNFTEPTAKKGRGRLKGSAGGPKKANLPKGYASNEFLETQILTNLDIKYYLVTLG